MKLNNRSVKTNEPAPVMMLSSTTVTLLYSFRKTGERDRDVAHIKL